MQTSSIKLQWLKEDRRTWAIGIAIGNIAGLFYFVSYPAIANVVRQTIPVNLLGWNVAEIVAGFGWFLALVIGPTLMPLLAKKYTFFWGLLPMPFFFAWNFFEAILESKDNSQSIFTFLLLTLLASVVSLALIGGPVSFFRWKFKGRPKWTGSGSQADKLTEQSTIWPPPPNI